MTTRHVAFIVEDDPMIADILKDLVTSLGHAWVHASTLEEARALMAAGGYCYLLLDMQIPANATDKANVGCGETILRLARRKAPVRNAGDKHVMPIIVVTSYSSQPDFVSKVFQNGADDFVPKPFGARLDLILDKIRDALKLAEREDHEDCEAAGAGVVSAAGDADAKRSAPLAVATARAPAAPVAASTRVDPVRIAIDGVFRDQRNDLLVNGALASMPDATFVVLLTAIGVHLKAPGEWDSAARFGLARKSYAPSRIVSELGEHLPPGFRVIETSKPQNVRLNPAIVVERVDWVALGKHPWSAVKKVAGEFGRG